MRRVEFQSEGIGRVGTSEVSEWNAPVISNVALYTLLDPTGSLVTSDQMSRIYTHSQAPTSSLETSQSNMHLICIQPNHLYQAYLEP